MFHKQSSQLGFIVFVTLVDVHQLGFDALGEHVDPVDWASLEGMRWRFAIEAEQELAVLAPACVLRLFEVRNTVAALERAPAHVVHLSDRIVQREFFVFLNDFWAQAEWLNVEVIQLFAAILLSTLDQLNLSLVYFKLDKLSDALKAEVVLTPRQEEELISE